MATAPRPMTETRAEQSARTDTQQTVLLFTVADATYRIAPFNVPIREKLIVQRETGLTWEDIIGPLIDGHVSSAGLAVLVWMARRAGGEPRLGWDPFAAEWDEQDIGSQVTLEVEGPDEAGDDPEA